MRSSFFHQGPISSEGQLALIHLSRDQSLPVILTTRVKHEEDEGYAEGMVTNTRFGSFPHSTLLDIPWGSQVRASKVDTGSRGRQSHGRKRKADAISADSPATDGPTPALKQATQAASGFIHLLPPTPENWTTSLPHRTQVVYTPDYSYILHRIKARPGSVLIEAGSGSGSFTHAAARAVYVGESDGRYKTTDITATRNQSAAGRVFTFEFHPQRHEKLLEEMIAHGLDDVVTATHRDVYKDGFLLPSSTDNGSKRSPRANAIFLDLPAPWDALPHLTRAEPSALDPNDAVHICTFSPCIEQAQRTISALRRQGWVDIEMVEMQHKRIEVKREYTGLKYDGMRNVNVIAADVNEALTRLRDHEERMRDAQLTQTTGEGVNGGVKNKKPNDNQTNRQIDAKILIDEGNIIHRSEPELKTHTSYLVFALLPRHWSEEDEQDANAKLQQSIDSAPIASKSHRQLKKEAKLRKKARGGGRSDIPGANSFQQDAD